MRPGFLVCQPPPFHNADGTTGYLEQRVRFELTALGFCRPLHWASLPPLRIISIVQSTFALILLLRIIHTLPDHVGTLQRPNVYRFLTLENYLGYHNSVTLHMF